MFFFYFWEVRGRFIDVVFFVVDGVQIFSCRRCQVNNWIEQRSYRKLVIVSVRVVVFQVQIIFVIQFRSFFIFFSFVSVSLEGLKNWEVVVVAVVVFIVLGLVQVRGTLFRVILQFFQGQGGIQDSRRVYYCFFLSLKFRRGFRMEVVIFELKSQVRLREVGDRVSGV